MTIAWMSFPYTSSSVPSSPPGSWWSIARSVVQTCGHLNFGFTAFTSNDCWSVEESPGDPVGRNGPTGNKFALAPGFESTFPIHTNGTRPVKMPVPPRTWVRRSPEAFQLKPRRGDHSAAALGSLLVDDLRIAVRIQRREAAGKRIVHRICEVHRKIDPQAVGEVQPFRHRVLVLQVKAQLPDRDILALVQSRRRIRGRAKVDEGGVLALVVGARIGSQEELIQGRKRAAAEVSKAIGRREKEHPVPEDVERVEEREFLEVRPERYDVLPPEPGEVVGELPHVLVEDIVNRKRLVAHGRVGDASITTVGHEPFSIHNILDQDVWQLTDNFSWFRGKHVVTLGANFEKFSFFNSFNIFRYGVFFLAPPDSFGHFGGSTFSSLDQFFLRTNPGPNYQGKESTFIDFSASPYAASGLYKGEDVS